MGTHFRLSATPERPGGLPGQRGRELLSVWPISVHGQLTDIEWNTLCLLDAYERPSGLEPTASWASGGKRGVILLQL